MPLIQWITQNVSNSNAVGSGTAISDSTAIGVGVGAFVSTSTGLITADSFVGQQAVGSATANSFAVAGGRVLLVYTASGTAYTGGSATTNYRPQWNQSIVWQTRASIRIDKNFAWNTGTIPLRWYRVQGCCRFPTAAGGSGGQPGGCDIIGIQTDDPKCVGSQGKVQYIQNVVARGLSDLCTQISNSRLNWEICSIKVWSRPANVGGDPASDQCNTLTEVPWQDVPECIEFDINTDAIVKIACKATVVDAIFFYQGSGGAVTGGSATTSGGTGSESFFVYHADGVALTGGSAETSSSWNAELLTSMVMTASVEDVEAVFGVGSSAPALILPPQITGTICGSCTSMPVNLYLFSNIATQNILTSYMARNGLSLPNPLTMHYSARTLSWAAHYHMNGTSNDNSSAENWRFSFEWGCTSSIDGDNLGSNVWRFSALIVRKNQNSGINFDTRFLVVFPPDNMCDNPQNNLGFNFSFSTNTATDLVTNSFNIVPHLVLLTDNIGLFNSSYWSQSPNLNITLSQNKASPKTLPRQNIYPIFPQAAILTS